MSLQAKTAEKLAECLGSHASFKAEHKQCGHDQADEPGAACLCLPQRRLRVAVSAIDRLPVSMHATFGKPSVIRQAPDALLPVLTNRIENNNALGPQSHGVGPSSGGWLTSRKSALQSTRSTATCPALRGWPKCRTRPKPSQLGGSERSGSWSVPRKFVMRSRLLCRSTARARYCPDK